MNFKKNKQFFAQVTTKNNNENTNKELKKLSSKIAAIIFVNLISVIVISQLLLASKIYIPGFYWISQTVVYQNEKQLESWSKEFIFNFKNLFFFGITFFINISMSIFAYFWIGKIYAKFSALYMTIWFVFGVIVSLNDVQNLLGKTKIFDFGFKDVSQRTKQISFYIIAFISGFSSGLLNSIIWKYNFSGDGLDIIYTYLAIQKKKEIHKISLPISLVTLCINIIINEVGGSHFNLLIFTSLLIASLTFSYTRATVINHLYPKYKITTVMIITTKGPEVTKELCKFYGHGGNIIQTQGLYKKEPKEIIITSMTYLEKNKVIKTINKIDKKAFFVGLPTDFVEGKFNFFNN